MSQTKQRKFIIEHSGVNDIQADYVSISHGGANNITGGDVSITMGGANEITAEMATVRQGGVHEVTAKDVIVRQGGIVQATANQISLSQGGIALAQTEQATCAGSTLGALIASGNVMLEQSVAKGVVVQGSVEIDQSAVGAMVSREVTVKNGAVMILLAGKVNGNVQPLLGPQTALIFGAAFGFVFGMVMWLRKRFAKTVTT